MEAHWENSSSNAIVRDILATATETTKSQIEALISGEAVEKVLIPELTYTDLGSEDKDVRQTYLWSVLFAAGYLTDAQTPENRIHKLVIPNREVMGIYEKRIRSWFKVKITSDTARWKKFCESVKAGDAPEMQRLFNEFLSVSISIRDTFVRKEMNSVPALPQPLSGRGYAFSAYPWSIFHLINYISAKPLCFAEPIPLLIGYRQYLDTDV